MTELIGGVVPYLSGYDIILNVTLAFLLGLFVALIYRATIQGGLPSVALTHTLMMLAMITALVMMAIGDSVARAFSLVGALSIIRFRTVVKDNRDTAFVFFSLAAGIACGAGSHRIAVLGTLTIGLLVLLIFAGKFGQNGHRDFLLRLRMVPDDTETPLYSETFQRFLRSHTLLHVRSLQLGSLLEMTFQVQLRNQGQDRAFISQLSTLEGVERVALVSGDEAETP